MEKKKRKEIIYNWYDSNKFGLRSCFELGVFWYGRLRYNLTVYTNIYIIRTRSYIRLIGKLENYTCHRELTMRFARLFENHRYKKRYYTYE